MTAADEHTTPVGSRAAGRSRWARAVLWGPGLAVAFGAAAATAHGLFEVALAARVPGGIAWLYPLITDGLALVAYAATARLSGREARYAWAVVVVAAGLSGLAQAVYLATDPIPGAPGSPAGPVLTTPPVLRFGIGAWPAVAAAVVAHLLYLLAAHPSAAEDQRPGSRVDTPASTGPGAGEGSAFGVQPHPYDLAAVQPPGQAEPVHPEPPFAPPAAPDPTPGAGRSPASPVRDRAEQAATRHARRHGHWPTVSELETAAEVSRGTAAAALKALRDRPLPAPHLAAPPPGRPAERPAAPPTPADDHPPRPRHRLDDEAHTP